MPLDYAHFRHHYEGYALSEAQQREHFASFAGIMECLVRHFWREEEPDTRLGISLDSVVPALAAELASEGALRITFRRVASDDTPGKQTP